ncbi:MAG: M1 family aminopeptidase [Gemmatimonadota bacterium]|nr:M1 family aminopeptidase [Gemmatimonadota bacterium]
MRIPGPALALLLLVSPCSGQEAGEPPDPYDSGGRLDASQAAYDVEFYDLAVRLEPRDSTLAGTLTLTARLVAVEPAISLDLDPRLEVREVTAAVEHAPSAAADWSRDRGRIRVPLPEGIAAGDRFTVRVEYGGRPRVAPRPPWDGGVTWARTPSGAPWIATSNQTIGADVWWPVKDHISDKPDSVALHVTVPDPLVVATNGRSRGTEPAGEGWTTWHWFVSTPISVYNVALNIAPYVRLDTTVASVAGDTFPVSFWVLPESEEAGRAFLPEIVRQLRWFEETLGPYPFRADKYGVAQTPHLGMEHQTIIAYGADFANGAMTGGVDWGFDALHHHELSHEWWGNLVTNADWKDMWLHEGFGTYMQALYVLDLQGEARYLEYMRSLRPRIGNRKPVAPREVTSARDIYDGHDIYFKGAWILHTLRWKIGDEALRRALRRMAYPDEARRRAVDGSQVRFADTEEFRRIAEEASGEDLERFFEVYVYGAGLPELEVSRGEETVELAWRAPDGKPFELPVPVRVGGELRRVEMPGGRATVEAPGGSAVIDPEGRILYESGH